MKKLPLNSCLRLIVTLLAFCIPGVIAAEKKADRAAAPYQPTISPVYFTNVFDNPYFPLVPGTTFTFVEKERRERRENKVTVTRDTKMVMGVKCVVLHDTVALDGVLIEDTYDWYAQDNHGTVWYFGEATREFKSNGRVITNGSWEAGVNGQPGVMMPANPEPGPPYRQEYSPKNAEDMGQVTAVGESVTVPYGTFTHCVKTKDWSLLESGFEHKWFAKGVGLVRTRSSSGEVSTLMCVTRT